VAPPWSIAFRVNYRIIRWLDPLIRVVWQAVGIGNVVELRVSGRRTGADRRVLLGLLRVAGRMYLGHPNGDSEWTRNLAAAGEGTLVIRGAEPILVRPIPLASGAEREAVIQATSQHPFPGNLLYRLARGHVRAVGVYFRLEPIGREGR
jgi:hypothetical protein